MRFIIFVIDDLTASASDSEMSAINKFNDQLRSNKQFIFAWGLQPPASAKLIDNRKGANLITDHSLFLAKEHYSGFWLIDCADTQTANSLALQASLACNRKVELRPLH